MTCSGYLSRNSLTTEIKMDSVMLDFCSVLKWLIAEDGFVKDCRT